MRHYRDDYGLEDYDPELRQEVIRRRRAQSQRYDEEEEATEEELEHILARLDHYRSQLESGMRELNQLLSRYPDLRQQYESFLRSGGISSRDFGRFLEGDMRPRLTPRKGHLRLVSSRPRLVHRLRIRRPSDEPDDAA
jgi:phosphoenolpyruvate carboxylase